MKREKPSRERAIERLRKMTDVQLRALSDADFWDAIEPEGVCPGCDPRLAAEAVRRNNNPDDPEMRNGGEVRS
jgi:hypothetical protein